MQEKFRSTAAMRAALVFKKIINDDIKKAELNNSNKALIMLTTIAYFGECSATKLKRALPVQLTPTIDELVNLGYVTKRREGKEVTYKYKDKLTLNYNSKEFNESTLYLFANALMNISTYFSKFDVRSWNVLALMLETALKEKFDNNPVDITEGTIKSVIGNTANKLLARKTLENLGVIRSTEYRGGRAFGGQYKLNKEAYIIEVK